MGVSALFWDWIANRFDTREETVGQARSRAVERAMGYLHGSDVLLDFGCGTGSLAVALAGSVKAVVGIDFSSRMIALAKKKAQACAIENIEFRHGTLFDRRLEKGSFDVILATGILHLLRDPEKAVRRIYELLKPGGWFLSSTPCIGSEAAVGTMINRITYLPRTIGVFPYLRFLRIADLEQMVSKERFEIVERESLTFGTRGDGRYVIARYLAANKTGGV